MIFKINKSGVLFFENHLNDTKKSIYIAGPLLLIFFSVIFLMILGASVYYFLTLVIILLIIFYNFYKKPFFDRRKLIKKIVKEIHLDNDHIELYTEDFF